MITLDLQNKGEEFPVENDGYLVTQVEYEESDLFKKFIHVYTYPITEGSFIIKNEDNKLTVSIDKNENDEDNMYSFTVYFNRYGIGIPLMIIIESDIETKYFRYSDLMGNGKPTSKKLSDIEDYNEDVSILQDLYDESFKADSMLIYRLERKKGYNGVEVTMDDENINSRVYVHKPKEGYESYKSCVLYNNKMVYTTFEDGDKYESIDYVQNKVYEKIKVSHYGDKDEGNLIELFSDGRSYTYEKIDNGTWKYKEGYKLEDDKEEGDEETVTTNPEDIGPNTSSEENTQEHDVEKDEEGDQESDNSEERVLNFSQGSDFHNSFINKINQQIDEITKSSGSIGKQISDRDGVTSSSGLQSKKMTDKEANEVKNIDNHRDNTRTKVLTGTLVPVAIGVCACPAYLAYVYCYK